MHSKKLLFLTATLVSTLALLQSVPASPVSTLNLPDPQVNPPIIDDNVPDVTARVARISFIKGDVQIKRSESQDWEQATLNLPIVEGDEITTATGARLEIQFNRSTHIRLDQNSYLKVLTLMDEGIALSLPQGEASLHADDFDKEKSYIEVDAPGSTIAIQRSGMYRIDTDDQFNSEVRVSVTDGGEARIYSENSGFLLKSGRSARVFINGGNVGEWETSDAARYRDEFDSWAIDRDSVIASSLQKAYFDKYYDRDIYGAEDLNDYGEWVYTRSYGYVWRPYRSSVSSYADWSPYRYGQWRWIPPYGWTWINDEPWGWATYHHGRWFFDNGYWYWTPYGQYRYSRSWWAPALVVITTWGGNICWYPLPYSYAYYNYNWYYNSQHGWNPRHGGGGHNGGGGPTPTPTPGPNPPIGINGPGLAKVKRPPLGTVPPTGVVTVPAGTFSERPRGTRLPPLAVATEVLTTTPPDRPGTPILPQNDDVKIREQSGVYKTQRPKIIATAQPIKTGAMIRKADAPLDNELRTTRVFGGRSPVVNSTPPIIAPTGTPSNETPRNTGAVDRKPPIRPYEPSETTKVPPPDRDKPVEPVVKPRYTPPSEERKPVEPPMRPAPRYDPPPRQEQPRYTPPPRQDPPPRQPPPPAPTQKPKSDPPPTKSDPKPDKPAPTENKGSRKPDGR